MCVYAFMYIHVDVETLLVVWVKEEASLKVIIGTRKIAQRLRVKISTECSSNQGNVASRFSHGTINPLQLVLT